MTDTPTTTHPLDRLATAREAEEAAKAELTKRLEEITKEAESIRVALGIAKPKRTRRSDAGKPRERKALKKGLPKEAEAAT